MQIVFPSVSTGQLIYRPAETPVLTLAQIFPWMMSSKLSNKGFLNHAGVGPLSKKTAARGPLSRYELEAELRTTIPERQRKEHHAGLKGRERRHEQALWEQQRLAAPHRQASQKPRVHPKEAMPLMVGLRPAGSEHSRQS